MKDRIYSAPKVKKLVKDISEKTKQKHLKRQGEAPESE
jgi:hypothetical protein